MKIRYPKIAEWILIRTTNLEDRQALAGDFAEIFESIALEKGVARAYLWYWLQALISLPPLIYYSISWSIIMLKSYFKTALRSIAKQKLFSAINIFGLSTGLACSLLIFLYISDEFSYDRFHTRKDSLYAVVCHDDFHGNTGLWTTITMGEGMKDEFPEIESTVTFSNMETAVVRYGDKLFNERPVFSDPEFLTLFTFPLKHGSAENALSNENSLVITESIAEKYFGSENPMGKSLTFAFDRFTKEFTVTAIAYDVPKNSTVRFGFLVRKENLRFIKPEGYMDNWRWKDSRTFVTLKNNSSPEVIKERFPAFVKKYFAERIERHRSSGGEGDVYSFWLTPLSALHLDTSISNVGAHDLKTSYILTGIGLLILVVACINFINLTVGSASQRAVEIGMRKVMGAQRKQLIRQFWCESFLTAGFSMMVGMMLTIAVMPAFNSIADKNLEPATLLTPVNIIAIILLTALVGTAAGSFPGIVLSGFKPVDIMRGKKLFGPKSRFMSVLVVLQFSCSVFLIISSLVMTQQLNHMRNLDTGFSKDGVIAIQTQESSWVEGGPRTVQLLERFKEKASAYPEVLSIAGSTSSFNRLLAASHFMINGKEEDVFFNRVYYGFINTMNIKLREGRDFSPEFPSDSSGVLVNKRFVEEYELKDPIGYTFTENGPTQRDLHVIGVVEDYNYRNLTNEISPLALTMYPEFTLKHILVKVSDRNIPGTLEKLEQTWKEVEPGKPFLYSFVDDDFEAAFNSQRKWNSIILYSSLFAIVISCMGIFGLSIIVINRRTREIGIRKVLGASTTGLVGITTKQFIILVGLANIVAWPAAYFAMNSWLSDFPYRIEQGITVFIAAALFTLAIALVTVSVQAFRAAASNPVNSLRSE